MQLAPRLGILVLLGVGVSFAANHLSARIAFDHGATVAAGVAVRAASTALILVLMMRLQGVALVIPRELRAWSLLAGVRKHRVEIDKLLVERADNWTLERMAVTDRNILRLGAFEMLYGGTPEDIQKTIFYGRQGVMPPWEAMLGQEGVFDVTEYVRSLSGREVDALVAARGRDLYNQNCAACHGGDGRGNQALGAPNLTDNIWLHGGTQKRIQETIARGRNSHMPAHKEFLGAARVHLLATYVFGLRVDKDITDR